MVCAFICFIRLSSIPRHGFICITAALWLKRHVTSSPNSFFYFTDGRDNANAACVLCCLICIIIGHLPCFDFLIWPMDTNDIACLTQPCPDPKSTEWQHLQELCCSQGGKFHCQSNDLSLSKRLCMEPIECPAGRKFLVIAFKDLLGVTLPSTFGQIVIPS